MGHGLWAVVGKTGTKRARRARSGQDRHNEGAEYREEGYAALRNGRRSESLPVKEIGRLRHVVLPETSEQRT